MKRSLFVRGLAAVVALVTVTAVGTALLKDDDGSASTVEVTIPDAGALEKGNDVRAAGVRIGSVRDVELVDGQAKVTLTVDPALLPLHTDATLKVRPVNLLGENYLDLDAGSDDKPFMKHAVIASKNVESAVTLQDVLNTFQAPTAASLAAVVTTLGEGLAGNGGETAKALKTLLPAMDGAQDLGKLLDEQNQVLTRLVTTLDPVTGALATDQGRTLDRLVASTKDALSAITADQDALKQTIVELPGTLRSARATLAQFGGVADQAAPTLHALRPLTGNLRQVVSEIQQFADAADPALASLKPVLQHADELLDQAAPVVAQLSASGAALRRTAKDAVPVSNELLDEHLGDVMDFVRKWALSTNGRDALGHYFRGVLYVTPQTLRALAKSLIPQAPLTRKPGTKSGKKPKAGLLPDLSGLGLGSVSNSLNNLLGDPLGALGFTSKQEQNLLTQLLGGGK